MAAGEATTIADLAAKVDRLTQLVERLLPSDGPAEVASPYLGREQVCKLLGISKVTLWRRVMVGEIPKPLKVGRLQKWLADEIEAAIKRKRSKG